MEYAIQTDGLTRRFGRATAVDGLSLRVEPGEAFALLGPNGAGKTTTIKMLITLLPPSSGSATVASHDVVTEQRLVRQSIGYVPQLISSDGALTARENLWTSARLYHIPADLRKERIETALNYMGLASVAHRLVRTFSGGMIRRLEIAQAMLHRPQVLFLDEPTIGLDPAARRTVWDHVRRLRDREGTTILLTTHYMEEAVDLCQRVGIMQLGRMVVVGSPEDLAADLGPDATLDDVFTHFTGADLEEQGTFSDHARTSRNARRLG